MAIRISHALNEYLVNNGFAGITRGWDFAIFSRDYKLWDVRDIDFIREGDILKTQGPLSGLIIRSGIAMLFNLWLVSAPSYFIEGSCGCIGADINLNSATLNVGDTLTIDNLQVVYGTGATPSITTEQPRHIYTIQFEESIIWD